MCYFAVKLTPHEGVCILFFILNLNKAHRGPLAVAHQNYPVQSPSQAVCCQQNMIMRQESEGMLSLYMFRVFLAGFYFTQFMVTYNFQKENKAA